MKTMMIQRILLIHKFCRNKVKVMLILQKKVEKLGPIILKLKENLGLKFGECLGWWVLLSLCYFNFIET